MNFLTNIAWIFGVLFTVLFIGRCIGFVQWEIKKENTRKLLPNKRFIEKKFYIPHFLLIAIICWTWILSQ